jgi:hypothetical protein
VVKYIHYEYNAKDRSVSTRPLHDVKGDLGSQDLANCEPRTLLLATGKLVCVIGSPSPIIMLITRSNTNNQARVMTLS